MLLNNLYKIAASATKKEESQFVIDATLDLNKDHKIFEGHFPGLPILPGVCMMQIVKELVELKLEKKLQVSSAANLKFLLVINPQEQGHLKAEVKFKQSTQGDFDVEGKLYFEAIPFFKMKATAKVIG
jgi:3-hydroxyacyl-[acyl-carrier-protein] dehydratase